MEQSSLRRTVDGVPACPPRRHARAVTISWAAVLVAAVVVLGWLGGGPLAASGPVPPGAEAPSDRALWVARRSYVVQPGDTLWAIARQVQPTGDVRPLVSRLADGRDEGPLRPGELLLLP